MAVTLVQTATPSEASSSVASSSVSLSGVAAGNCIRVSASWYLGGGSTAPTISDSGGNTYAKLIEADAGAEGVAIYLCKNVAAGGSLTITGTNHGGSTFISLGAAEYTGQDATTQAGAANSATSAGSSTTPSSGSITPASGSMVVSSVTHDTGNTPGITAGSGWTTRDAVVGASGVCLGTEDRAGAGSAVSGDWAFGAAVTNWAAVVVEIQASSGGGGPAHHSLSLTGCGT